MEKSVFSSAYLLLLEELIASRKAAGLNQQAIADVLGKPQSFVSKIESGERRLDVAELISVCDAIGVRASTVLRRIESNLFKAASGKEQV